MGEIPSWHNLLDEAFHKGEITAEEWSERRRAEIHAEVEAQYPLASDRFIIETGTLLDKIDTVLDKIENAVREPNINE